MHAGNPELVELIRAAIHSRGPVTFAWFMEQALYHPEHGYYSSGRARIGRKGDYFTNVSVGPLFGRLMAGQFAEIWQRMGEPAGFTIVEEGSHGGDFARDLRQAAEQHHPHFFRALRYLGREVHGPDLEPFSGLHFSNELIDSFPVHLVKWTGKEWRERHVDLTDDGFAFIDLPLTTPELAEHVATIPEPLPAGYETEINLSAQRWVETLATALTRGYVIAVDYGFPRDEFYAPHRTSGTLQCYQQHKVVPDPLTRVGEMDISTHVEWSSLIECAQSCGFEVAGFTDQHRFITGLLTEEIVQDAKSSRALQTLLHPEFMGSKFQVLVLAKNVESAGNLSGLRFAQR